MGNQKRIKEQPKRQNVEGLRIILNKARWNLTGGTPRVVQLLRFNGGCGTDPSHYPATSLYPEGVKGLSLGF